MTDLEFERCIELMKQGSSDGLKKIYEEYLPMIFNTVKQMVQIREDAEDITSDVFVRIYECADQYRLGSTGHKAWLLTIARNMAKNHLRKASREVSFGDDSSMSLTTDGTVSIMTGDVGDTSSKENGQATSSVESEVIGSMFVMQALETLKPAEREVVHLRIVCDLSFREISELIGKSTSTVTSLYYAAIKTLRRFGFD